MATKSTSNASKPGAKSRSRTGTAVASKAGSGKKSPAASRSSGGSRMEVKGTQKARAASGRKPRARVSHEDISKRAYEIYLQREPNEGSPESDWFRAEEELYSDPGI